MNMNCEFSEQTEWALKQIADTDFAEGVRAAFRAMLKLQSEPESVTPFTNQKRNGGRKI